MDGPLEARGRRFERLTVAAAPCFGRSGRRLGAPVSYRVRIVVADGRTRAFPPIDLRRSVLIKSV